MSKISKWGIPPCRDVRAMEHVDARRKVQFVGGYDDTERWVNRYTHRRYADIVIRSKPKEVHVLRFTRSGAISIVSCPHGPIEGQDLMFAMTRELPCKLCMHVVGALRAHGPQSWSFHRGDRMFAPKRHWVSPNDRASRSINGRLMRMEGVAKNSAWEPPCPFVGRRAAHALDTLEISMGRACPCTMSAFMDIGPWSADISVDARPFRETKIRARGTVPLHGLLRAERIMECIVHSKNGGYIAVAHAEPAPDGVGMDVIGFKFEQPRWQSHWHRGHVVRDMNGWTLVRWYRNGGVE